MRNVGGARAVVDGQTYEAHATVDPAVISIVTRQAPAPGSGFSQVTPTAWRKRVRLDDVSDYYTVEVRCRYRGLECVIGREDGDRVEIYYQAGNAFAARDAGLTEVDRGVWKTWVGRTAVADSQEVRRALR
jgi:hypothetical protein